MTQISFLNADVSMNLRFPGWVEPTRLQCAAKEDWCLTGILSQYSDLYKCLHTLACYSSIFYSDIDQVTKDAVKNSKKAPYNIT